MSPSLPSMLYGDPAVRFYATSMPPPSLIVFPTGISRILSTMSVRWSYLHGDPAQVSSALNTLLPCMLQECPTLSQFLVPSHGSAGQVAAYALLAKTLAPAFEAHRLDTAIYLDRQLSPYVPTISGVGAGSSPEVKAFAVKAAVDSERLAVATAPNNDPSAVRSGAAGGSANPANMQALVQLNPVMQSLLDQLKLVWNSTVQNPLEVFRVTLAYKSCTCHAILFSNLTGVRAAGPVFAILEDAAAHRNLYFSTRLATPKNLLQRPDYNTWYFYPEKIEAAVRSPDFDAFAKINLFDLGAQIRKLQKRVTTNPSDIPKPGQEFSPDTFVQHLRLLKYIDVWLDAHGFEVQGESGYAAALQTLAEFCELGSHHHTHIREAHVSNMRTLYAALLRDMHSGMACFWNKRLNYFDLLVDGNDMFPEQGNFYGTHRRMNSELETINLISSFGYVAPSVPSGSSKQEAVPGSGRLEF